MNALVTDLLPAVALFALSLFLASGCLWLAGRVAPLFFRGVVQAPEAASFFLDPKAEMDGGWDRSAVGVLAFVFCVVGACVLFVIARALGLPA